MSSNHSLLCETSTTPTNITLLFEDQYESWLSKQNAHTQSWLTNIGFKGKGHQIIPGTDGNLEGCIATIKRNHDFFIASDLPLHLPKRTYQVNLNELDCPDVKEALTNFAISWGLANYKFKRYKSNLDSEGNNSSDTASETALETSELFIDDPTVFKQAVNFVEGISLVRDLVNTPASDMMPEDLTASCIEMTEKFDASLKVLVGEQLLEQNYPTIHAVGRASVHEPRLLDLTWGDETAPKVTLVGKGVCFDSGGLDLKPSNAMRLMKKDMGGAAHVLGLAHLIMSSNLPIRLRVLVPAVENAVSANAFRPGDVLTTRSGLTVEVDNTDAEGRLVLCDALTEACTEEPELIVDYATLTGACRVALGTELPGFFSNCQATANSLMTAAADVKDPVWQLPLHKPYNDMLKSDIADTLNSAATGFGGAITAALYLEKFVDTKIPWIHFDVMAWNNRKLPGRPIGGEAFAVRAIYELIKKKYNL